MPRIPEGNFRRDPSVRVENEALPRIEAPGAQQVARLGGQFLQLGNRLEAAQSKANSLEKASQAQSDMQGLLIDLDGIRQSSSRGKIKDANGTVKGSLSQITSDKINEFNEKQKLSFGNDDVAWRSYKGSSNSVFNTRVRNAFKQENVEITQGTVDDHVKEASLIEQRFLDTGSLDGLAEWESKSTDVAEVAGFDRTKGIMEAVNKRLAFGTPRMLATAGNTVSNQQTARRLIAGLPEIERRETSRKLEETINTLNRQAVEFRDKNTADLTEGKDSIKPDEFKKYTENIHKIKQLSNSYLNSPFDPRYETVDERVSGITKIFSKEIALDSIAHNATGSDAELASMAIPRIEHRVRRDLASSSFGKSLSEEQLDSISADIAVKVNKDIQAYKTKQNTHGGLTEVAFNMDESTQEDLNSGNPALIGPAVAKIYKFASDSGVDSANVTLAVRDEAEAFGKRFQDLKKGQGDFSGEVSADMVDEIRQRGEYAPKTMGDMYKLSGGTKGGAAALPAIFTVALKMDRTETENLFSSLHKQETNILNIAGQDQVAAGKVKAQIKNRINIEAGIDKLYAGRDGENIGIHEGYKEALTAMTADIMANSKLNVGPAVTEAIENLGKTMNVVTTGETSIVLDKTSSTPIGDTKKTLKDISNGKGYADAGIRLDVDTLTRISAGSPAISALLGEAGLSISPKGEIIHPTKNGKKISEQELNDRIFDSLSDHIHFGNDPDNPNTVKGYLWQRGRKPIPLPMLTKTKVPGDSVLGADADATTDLRIDFDEYHNFFKVKTDKIEKDWKDVENWSKSEPFARSSKDLKIHPSISDTVSKFRGNNPELIERDLIKELGGSLGRGASNTVKALKQANKAFNDIKVNSVHPGSADSLAKFRELNSSIVERNIVKESLKAFDAILDSNKKEGVHPTTRISMERFRELNPVMFFRLEQIDVLPPEKGVMPSVRQVMDRLRKRRESLRGKK